MFLLEHDAKTLLAAHGAAMPAGALLESVDFDTATLPAPPWMIKAQIPVGGRGKAGLIRTANSADELRAHARDILGKVHKGMTVRSCRVETRVGGADETYLSFMLDPVSAGVRIMVAAQGGVEIETLAATEGAVRNEVAMPRLHDLNACWARLTAGFAPHVAAAINSAGPALARAFLEGELSLLEINPLFVHKDGTWTAGDAKVVTNDDAIYRQPVLRALLEQRAAAYPEAYRKHRHGCDYVVVDPDGEIGLLTTGAGLSMMLIDELRATGLKPYNFLDVRTSGLRGDATRLVNVIEWIAEGKRVRVLLVNIFAGITDLKEFAQLLVEALARVPHIKLPVVARLVGTNLEAARDFLATHGIPVSTELGVALEHVRRKLA
jgi:succinyl-CoA synthetase beta subunit